MTDTSISVCSCPPDDWRAQAARFHDNNVYQTCAFADERAAEMNGEVQRMLVRRGSDVIGMAQARVKRLPVLKGGVAYIYRGPLWRRTSAGLDDLAAAAQELRNELSERRGLETRIVPAVSHCKALADFSMLVSGWYQMACRNGGER